jgi:type VI protein secretion system component Hcp
LAIGLVASLPAGAADIQSYLKIDDIPGESNRVGHVGEIELSAYSQTFDTRNCSRVVVNKLVDIASPALISRAASASNTARRSRMEAMPIPSSPRSIETEASRARHRACPTRAR